MFYLSKFNVHCRKKNSIHLLSFEIDNGFLKIHLYDVRVISCLVWLCFLMFSLSWKSLGVQSAKKVTTS
ncbi:hypothetical protein XFEB_01497 [Xylella fastidiosa EB92.1]|nr:hypothetical protein XFEB_01497 [Xylella fastidiosa EB92.1]